jgi:hypothetical protein
MTLLRANVPNLMKKGTDQIIGKKKPKKKRKKKAGQR